MPGIDNKTNTLLRGLSDFWTRFYADTPELEALYRGTEVLLAQTYLDMLSSFLNLSVTETPLFNTELFKLLTLREDALTFTPGASAGDDRHVYDLPDNVVRTRVLQNKVVEPTASFEEQAGYDYDEEELTLRFNVDPTGAPERVLGSFSDGNLLAFGTGGALKRLYVTSGTPFAKAKLNDWVRLSNSGSGNNKTYRIARLLDEQTVYITAATATSLTTPDANNGALIGTVYDAAFSAATGFAQRQLEVVFGGTFDDLSLRQGTEIESWFPSTPVGLGVRKGDILRVSDRAAVAVVPTDFTISLVRHDALYVSSDTPIADDATGVTAYTVLRPPPDPTVAYEEQLFAQTGTTKSGTQGAFLAGADGTPAQTGETVIFEDAAATFASTDRQRYIDISGSGAVSVTVDITYDGVLTRTAGMEQVFDRAAKGGAVTITGSSAVPTNDGTYAIAELLGSNSARLTGQAFVPETGLTATLVDVTLDGTYRIRKYLSATQVTVSLPVAFPDVNNGALSWTVHDGYVANLAYSRLQRNTVEVLTAVGDTSTGGRRQATEGVDYVVNYETGAIRQIGREAGRWGISDVAAFTYDWLIEVLTTTTGSGTLTAGTVTTFVSEVAMWAPDTQVDRFNLYNNYGSLINRFDASSEAYREFIRGIFQLYILGPTMERIESALNVIAAFPVIRDDDEVLISYDSSDSEVNVVTTQRPTGAFATYEFPKGLLLRTDVQDSANYNVLTFESFEVLTEAFQVVDYVDDPAWWTDIVIPKALMPNESAARRRTIGALVENTIGAIDNPRVGDLGLFIGADDEGVVPPFISTNPASRRKMANVAMERFLKWHLFYVSFDDTVISVLDPDFIRDLQELVVVGKPGYKYIYVEPLIPFLDTMLLEETTLDVRPAIYLAETMATGDQSLTVQSFSWDIGDYWRFNSVQTGAAVVVSNGTTVPVIDTPIATGAANTITKILLVGGSPSPLIENIDYTFDYTTGDITPLTQWPAGTYTMDYRPLVITANASANQALGDTPFSVGTPDPKLIRPRVSRSVGSIVAVGDQRRLVDTSAAFAWNLHVGQTIRIHEPVAAQTTCRITRVIDDNTVLLPANKVTAQDPVTWSFQSEEPTDGRIFTLGGALRFESASAIFTEALVGQFIQITGAVNSANNAYHQILSVDSMSRVVIGSGVAETALHWRLEGAQQQMALVERPLQITVT